MLKSQAEGGGLWGVADEGECAQKRSYKWTSCSTQQVYKEKK